VENLVGSASGRKLTYFPAQKYSSRVPLPLLPCPAVRADTLVTPLRAPQYA